MLILYFPPRCRHHLLSQVNIDIVPLDFHVCHWHGRILVFVLHSRIERCMGGDERVFGCFLFDVEGLIRQSLVASGLGSFTACLSRAENNVVCLFSGRFLTYRRGRLRRRLPIRDVSLHGHDGPLHLVPDVLE